MQHYNVSVILRGRPVGAGTTYGCKVDADGRIVYAGEHSWNEGPDGLRGKPLAAFVERLTAEYGGEFIALEDGGARYRADLRLCFGFDPDPADLRRVRADIDAGLT